jgi:tRNA-guanine family transglycosylase
MSSISHRSPVEFSVDATAGDARTGQLRVNETVLETPNLFPVLNFYAGGTEDSVYGGGVHRTMKEFMIGADRMGGGGFGGYFDAAMSSVSSLTDYNITRERFEQYLDTPIKERSLFEPFRGMLFLDSGGFKFLKQDELDGSDFEVDIDQHTVYDIQRRMGADIIVNLDHPIAPDDGYDERLEKAERTAENVETFLDLSTDFDGARYLTLHGYNYSMMDTFIQTIADRVGIDRVRQAADGIALGSLVPKKDNKRVLIDAVTDCREVLADWGFDDLPLHVLGISSSSIPILVALGVDSFDASSYLYDAINAKYSVSLTRSINLSNADFSECDCPVCSSEFLVNRMRGVQTQYAKDKLGPVAMHNLIVQKRELSQLRNRIRQPGTDAVIDYLESRLGGDKSMRPFVHEVVNSSLGGYF